MKNIIYLVASIFFTVSAWAYPICRPIPIPEPVCPMGIVVDAVSTASFASASRSTYTGTHTSIGTPSLVLLFTTDDYGAITGGTYGGQTLTLGGGLFSVAYLKNPPSGSQSWSLDIGGGPVTTEGHVGVVTLTGTDDTAAIPFEYIDGTLDLAADTSHTVDFTPYIPSPIPTTSGLIALADVWAGGLTVNNTDTSLFSGGYTGHSIRVAMEYPQVDKQITFSWTGGNSHVVEFYQIKAGATVSPILGFHPQLMFGR